MPPTSPLAHIFRVNTSFLLNAIDGFTDADAAWSPAPGVNNGAFLVAHCIDSRHFAASLCGRPLPNPLATILNPVMSVEQLPVLPTLDELRALWRRIGDHLLPAVEALDADALARPVKARFPGADGTLGAALAFLAEHDSYHVGQLGYLRRLRGMKGMALSV